MLEPNDFEQEWEDLDEKVILAQQTAILIEIRDTLQLLTNALSDASEDSQEQAQNLTCTVCNKTILKSERQSHAESCFGWHSGMGDSILDDRFELAKP